MITVFCALYPEAKGFIDHFQLKKESDQKHFQVFSDGEELLRLVITGPGAVAAAAAVAEISTCYPPGEGDLILNFGSCAGPKGHGPVEGLYLCNKITEAVTGRTFYPDMIYRHPFGEAEVVTVPREWKAGDLSAGTGMRNAVCLYDMEAAAIYQAANYYYGPHQMLFLKVVTDHGAEVRDFTREKFGEIMQQGAKEAIPFLNMLLKNYCGNVDDFSGKRSDCCAKGSLRQQVEKDAALWGETLHCTVVMQRELTQILYYYAVNGVDYQERLMQCMENLPGQEKFLIPVVAVKDKREGKRILEELKAGLL